MATTPKSEYVGFTVNKSSRIYKLRVRKPDGAARNFTLAIAHRAFLSNRVRYQDAPEICFLKLERELLEHGDAMTASRMQVTDDELDAYRESHTRKPPRHRPRRPIKE